MSPAYNAMLVPPWMRGASGTTGSHGPGAYGPGGQFAGIPYEGEGSTLSRPGSYPKRRRRNVYAKPVWMSQGVPYEGSDPYGRYAGGGSLYGY